MKKWLTAREAADYLRMHPATFRNYVSLGYFPYYQHPESGTRRFLAEDLDAAFIQCNAPARVSTHGHAPGPAREPDPPREPVREPAAAPQDPAADEEGGA